MSDLTMVKIDSTKQPDTEVYRINILMVLLSVGVVLLMVRSVSAQNFRFDKVLP